jgi:peptide deformylase
MEIIKYPHPALRWKSRPVTQINADLRATVRRMFELMYEARGIGLAANQVGLPYRVFILNLTSDPDETEEEYVFINPDIVQRKGSVEDEEGCLSLPELYGAIRRAAEVVVEAFDLSGREFRLKLEELPARAVQHETDHLDGVLFIDRMTDAARRELEPKIDDFKLQFERQRLEGKYPSDDEIRQQLRNLECEMKSV